MAVAMSINIEKLQEIWQYRFLIINWYWYGFLNLKFKYYMLFSVDA